MACNLDVPIVVDYLKASWKNSKEMLYFQLTMYLIILFELVIGGSIIEKYWISCTADRTALSQSNLRRQDYYGLTSLKCMSMATSLDWVYLAILDSASGCTLYEINSVIIGQVQKGGTDLRCRTIKGFIGKFHQSFSVDP